MGYVDRHLLPGETVIYRARLHPIIFLSTVFFALIGVALLVAGLTQPSVSWLRYVAVAFFVVAAWLGVTRWMRRRSSEFVLTDKRVVVKVGVVRRHTLELLLAKVETIGVEQSIRGRLLNYGTIVVTGTGGTKEPFELIAKPLEFRKQVQMQASALQTPRGAAPA